MDNLLEIKLLVSTFLVVFINAAGANIYIGIVSSVVYLGYLGRRWYIMERKEKEERKNKNLSND
jgi:hypothetical protein